MRRLPRAASCCFVRSAPCAPCRASAARALLCAICTLRLALRLGADAVCFPSARPAPRTSPLRRRCACSSGRAGLRSTCALWTAAQPAWWRRAASLTPWPGRQALARTHWLWSVQGASVGQHAGGLHTGRAGRRRCLGRGPITSHASETRTCLAVPHLSQHLPLHLHLPHAGVCRRLRPGGGRGGGELLLLLSRRPRPRRAGQPPLRRRCDGAYWRGACCSSTP